MQTPKKLNRFENDFDDVEDIDYMLKVYELDLPDEDDAFFGIELESLEEYLGKQKVRINKNWTKK